MAVGGFSVMDNHLHVLVRLDPDVAAGLVGRGSRAALGTALSAARQVAAAAGGFRRLGSVAAQGRRVGGDGTRSGCKA